MPNGLDLTHPQLARLLRRQAGVLTRGQILAVGGKPSDIARMVRRRDLARAHPGIYVNHTGRLSRAQREWIAVLSAWPAALTADSALPRPQQSVIHVGVHRGRKVVVPAYVRVHRIVDLDQRVDWRAGPPADQLEQALIDEMAARIADHDVAAAFSLLARTAHDGPLSLEWMLAALASRSRVAGRRLIEDMVLDLRDGVCSVLERGFKQLVEQPHGLPRPSRQAPSRATGELTSKDVRYDEVGFIVELDGKAFHDDVVARDNDARRDLAELATSGTATARVTYGLVYGDSCRTAYWIATILRRRGWAGEFHRCPRCPGPAV